MVIKPLTSESFNPYTVTINFTDFRESKNSLSSSIPTNRNINISTSSKMICIKRNNASEYQTGTILKPEHHALYRNKFQNLEC